MFVTNTRERQRHQDEQRKMKNANTFRILVGLNWLLQFLLYVTPFSSWYADPAIEKLISIDGYGAIFHAENDLFYQAPLWGFFIASIGMLLFKNWARYFFIFLWLYGMITTIFYGFRVSEPTELFILNLVYTIDGMIIYLAFRSDLRIRFIRNRSE